MDMAEKSSRRGAVDLGVILMVLSFVVIGYFLYWLQGQAAVERAAATVTEDVAETPDDPNSGVTRVPAGDLVTGEGASTYAGQVVRVEPIQVAGLLGRQGFWLDVPQSPFLVSYSSALLADSVTVTPGSRVTVTGTVTAMSDSIAASWFEAGRIGEGDQLAASFASYFIEAQQIQTAPGGRGGN
jgi:cbb3-type cytochrome oxidase subunit 3